MTPGQNTIIGVEDKLDATDIFSEMMRVSDYQMFKSTGRASAMTMTDKEEPAAVISGIRMPDIPSLEVLRYMRREPILANIPVTGLAKILPIDIRIGLEAGASIYLTKPVGYLDLTKAMEKVLG